MLKFNKKYFILNLVLLSLLIYIAMFVNDQFVRPFLGDVLVVGWLYLLVRSFITTKYTTVAHCVLLFSCVIEIAQFFNLVTVLGLEHIKAARIIIGSTFDWLDIIAYIIGWASILLIEYFVLKMRIRAHSH